MKKAVKVLASSVVGDGEHVLELCEDVERRSRDVLAELGLEVIAQLDVLHLDIRTILDEVG